MKSSGKTTSALRLLFVSLTCTACIDQLLESPLILATGLGKINGLAPTPRETILAATDKGLLEISADGQIQKLTQRAALDVSTLPDHIVLLTDSGLAWGPYPENGTPLELAGRARTPQTQNIQAWYENKLLLGTDTGIQQMELNRGQINSFASSEQPTTDLSLIPQNNSTILAVSDQQLWKVSDGLFVPISSPLPVVLATQDYRERMWLVHGTTPQLSIQVKGQWTAVVQNLGTPTAITLGTGGLTPEDALYIATASGTLEFIRVP